jgi:predicted polyphosphate/ATP-dependent NAD kinase
MSTSPTDVGRLVREAEAECIRLEAGLVVATGERKERIAAELQRARRRVAAWRELQKHLSDEGGRHHE